MFADAADVLQLGSPDLNRDLTAPKAGGLPLHHSPVHARASAERCRYYDATVPAPTVVILAAGEGTRMRSSLPKVLHPLCGRPLIAWPIQAARDAGAGKVVVVDGPKRRLSGHLPEDVTVAVQLQPRGTGDAVAAATADIGDGDTVVVTMGDVPLVDAETLT